MNTFSLSYLLNTNLLLEKEKNINIKYLQKGSFKMIGLGPNTLY
jgi:hypothetical protein